MFDSGAIPAFAFSAVALFSATLPSVASISNIPLDTVLFSLFEACAALLRPFSGNETALRAEASHDGADEVGITGES